MLGDILANMGELQAIAEDQSREMTNLLPDSNEPKIWLLMVFPFVHSTVHVDILMTIATLTPPNKQQCELEKSLNSAAIL